MGNKGKQRHLSRSRKRRCYRNVAAASEAVVAVDAALEQSAEAEPLLEAESTSSDIDLEFDSESDDESEDDSDDAGACSNGLVHFQKLQNLISSTCLSIL